MIDAIHKIVSFIKETKYNIGFIQESLQDVIDGAPIHVNWLKHSYKDRWFADPFILDTTNDEIIVLVEEWVDITQRGRISKLVIDKKTYELKNQKVMIDLDTHLSFPAIERIGKDVFIHPENSITGELNNYRYNKYSDTFEKCDVLRKLPLTDSAITDFFGNRLLFSTKLPDANGKELGIYTYDKNAGMFVIKDYYHFDENISRMAGNFFTLKGKVYRPAQVCIKSYGDAVSLQEVTCHQGKWSFKEIRRIYSPNYDLDLGFHTFNVYENFIAIDAIGYRRAKLCHVLRKIKSWCAVIK